MHASEITPEVVERANELYWSSTRSVNQIAEDLDLSKGALYGIIEPEGSGLGCPSCGHEAGYRNRTAKDGKFLECSTCDWDGKADETTSYGDSSRVRGRRPASVAAPNLDATSDRGPTTSDLGRTTTDATAERDTIADRDATSDADATSDNAPEDDRSIARLFPRHVLRSQRNTIAGGALLGAAVGLALVMWARRR